MKRAFGPYLVEQELARGGMGVVYAVRHRETGVRYALKTVLSLSGLGGDELLRFRREADLMSRLDHPGIVKVHTAGVEAGVPYLVQSYLPGGSLQERLRERGRLLREEAVALVADLADAVAYAHEHEVLHRDLKPHNVLFDEQGRAVLVDFGLGRDLAAESQRLTETGAVMGTPGYMAPEQVEGERRDDPRTDVYGLGAILFALLTGQPPFTGRGLGILAKIVHDSAPDLSAIEPETPPALAATVARCLAKRPGDRFPSAADLARVLRSGEAPPTDRGAGLGAGLALFAALGLVVVGLVGGRSPEPGPIPSSASESSRSPEAVSPARLSPPEGSTWKDAAALITTPQQAWKVARGLNAPPPPELQATLVRKLLRQARNINTAEDALGSVLTGRQAGQWLACLRLLKKLQPKIPSDCVSELPDAITELSEDVSNRFPRAHQQAFAKDVVAALDGQNVRGLVIALAGFMRGLEGEPSRAAMIESVLRAAKALSPQDLEEWRTGQRAVLVQSARFGQIRRYRNEETKERDLAERISVYAEGVGREARYLLEVSHPLLWRLQAKVALQLGDLEKAHKTARLGRSRGDPLCYAVLAMVLKYKGKRRASVRLALEYLASLGNGPRGRTAYIQTLELLYLLRTIEKARQALEYRLPILFRDKQGLHLLRLRYVLMQLETRQEDQAKADHAALVRHIRATKGCCPETHHAAVFRVDESVTLESVRAALTPFDLELKRR